MKTAAISVLRLQLPSWSHATARLADFVSLMKPRVMLLAVFTALVGLVIAPGHLAPLLGSIVILAIAAGAGAAGVLNMWYDADIDAVMTRTARRPRANLGRTTTNIFECEFSGCVRNVMTFATLPYHLAQEMRRIRVRSTR